MINAFAPQVDVVSPACGVYILQKVERINNLPQARKTAPQTASAARVRRCKSRFAGQSPSPGVGEKYFSNLPSTPSHSLASAGGSFLAVILGHCEAYSVLTWSHLSSPGSVSGLIASAGHSGSHTPQSMHSSGWMTSMFSPS